MEAKTFIQEVFSLCMDPECDIAYFSADFGYLFFQRDIKAKLDHKDETEEKYVCYCQEITYNEVIKAVRVDGVKSIKEFFRFRKAVVVEKCKLTNPFGCSCIADIKKIIDEEI